MTDQKREYEDTLSVGKVLKDEFFPNNDLTTRLRDFDGINTPTAKLIVEAADRIEKLEAVVGWYGKAAEKTLEAVLIARECDPDISAFTQSPSGKGYSHKIWMLRQIAAGQITGTKAHRWLGYAQALCVVDGSINLEGVKKINKTASGKRARQALEVEEILGE